MNVRNLYFFPAVLLMHSTLSAATLYWDPDGASGLGGTGTWIDGGGNWSSDNTGTAPVNWSNANEDLADFQGTAGTVTVSGGVSASRLKIESAGYIITGDAIRLGTSGSGTSTGFTAVDVNTSGTTTINSAIIIDDAASINYQYATYVFQQTGANGTLNLNGDITLDYSSGISTTRKVFSFNASGASSVINIAGSILVNTDTATAAQSVRIGDGTSTGSYYFSGNNSAISREFRIDSGSVYAGSNNAVGSGSVAFGSTGSSGIKALYTNAAVTISSNMSNGGSGLTTVGGATAHDSTYSGDFNIRNANTSESKTTLTAAAGGRVNFSGKIYNTNTDAQSVTIDGDGIVAFTRAGGNEYYSSTIINKGTLLLMNTSGSATGFGTSTFAPAVVSIASGAGLGGTGSSAVIVDALAADSILTPGDMTKEGVSSIGTLNLDGGMTAANGVTLNIDIDGATSDRVDFGTGTVNIDGVVTVNFNALGSVEVGIVYSVLVGTGTWSDSSASFIFNTPDGYVLDSSYGGGNGYVWDTTEGSGSLSVMFAVPEPATYALLLSGFTLVVLAMRRRFRG